MFQPALYEQNIGSKRIGIQSLEYVRLSPTAKPSINSGLARREPPLDPHIHSEPLSGIARYEPTRAMSGDPEHRPNHSGMRFAELNKQEDNTLI